MVHLTSIPLFTLLALVAAAPFDGDLKLGMISRQAGGAANCKQMMVVFARGTTEPAPIGLIAGPPLQTALQGKVGAGNLDFQGVDYPADVAGFLAGGDAGGSKNMAQMVTQAVADCPNSDVVMVGYSQGGQLVHNAAKQLDAATAAKVSSAVIFGDPDNPDPVAQIANQKVICANGDLICAGQAVILAPHLSYGSDAGEAADFISQNAKAGAAAA
ncbi:putative cutinase protein [Neofusicoccum parvum]|uniref:cutinase n=2 Tax=Neofusicoccum parvum TaxID=310453 RepID=R1GW50_BOTPV|nr:putative cutinase protein [Neofusicoccum parvum UCRNP2]GME31374.1 putative cutinase protein [Neofusicoccum parvum]GME38754.1 putative cutinase protein [Neofusicoccum parvum]